MKHPSLGMLALLVCALVKVADSVCITKARFVMLVKGDVSDPAAAAAIIDLVSRSTPFSRNDFEFTAKTKPDKGKFNSLRDHTCVGNYALTYTQLTFQTVTRDDAAAADLKQYLFDTDLAAELLGSGIPGLCGAGAHKKPPKFKARCKDSSDCSPAVPGSLSTHNVAKSSVTLSWAAVPNIDQYGVRYRESGETGTGSWSFQSPVTGTSTKLRGLSSGTTYEWQILARCPDGSSTRYSDGAGPDFTTATGGGGGGGGGGGNDGGSLDPNTAPSGNFDLGFWKLTLNDASEVKDELSETSYEYKDQFFTDKTTGAMVFRNPSGAGKTTSGGTKYTRVELREMLRGTKNWWQINGDGGKYPKTFSYRNNWVFGSASSDIKSQSGGVNGVMTATLTVDRVSTDTEIEEYKVGRIVIGQIHAKGDEPIRLYYHKLPGNRRGGIYYAHEPTSGGKEQWRNLIGNHVEEGASAGKLIPFSDISDDSGIELGERFGYKIEVDDDMLYVTIYDKDGAEIASDAYDMSDSGYTDAWMYFKAGCYSQNVATTDTDYDQVSFYKLDVTHE